MAWSFDTGLGTDRDWVRMLVGDTDTTKQLVQDETITAVLGAEANRYMAAAEISEYVARKLMGGGALDDRKVGETRLRYKRAKDLILMAGQLRARGSAYLKPSSGGVYTADKDAYNRNTALDKTDIEKGMMDHPSIGSLSNRTTSTT